MKILEFYNLSIWCSLKAILLILTSILFGVHEKTKVRLG